MRSLSAPQILAAMYLATPLVHTLGADQLEHRYIGGSTGRVIRARDKKHTTVGSSTSEIQPLENSRSTKVDSGATGKSDGQTLERFHSTKSQFDDDGSDKISDNKKFDENKKSEDIVEIGDKKASEDKKDSDDKKKSGDNKRKTTHFSGHGALVAATLGAAAVGGGISGAISQIFSREAAEPAGLVSELGSESVKNSKENHSFIARKIPFLGKHKKEDKADPPSQSNTGLAITAIGGAIASSLAFNTIATLIKNGKQNKNPKSTESSNTTTPSAMPSAGPATRDVKEPQMINLFAKSTSESAIVDILQRGGVAVTNSGLQTIPGHN